MPAPAADAPTLGELLDLPPEVFRGDFVLNLSDGVTRPDDTLRHYVVTDQLVGCFDEALKFIRAALDARASKAAYLHGSFGAGKSHFMAVLHLLLQNHPAPGPSPNWPASSSPTRGRPASGSCSSRTT